MTTTPPSTPPLDDPATDPFLVARAAADHIAQATGVEGHDMALVLGSGWGGAAESLGEVVAEVPTHEIPGFSAPAVAGHLSVTRSIRVERADGSVRHALVLGSRTHSYEGKGVRAVVHGVRTAAATGAETLILTNGCGGLNQEWGAGTPVLLSDHINLTARSPSEGPTFVDSTDVYSPRSRELAHRVDPTLPEGVYAQFPGPHYETPAEVRMAGILGADLVGMSTTLEAIAARHCGSEVLGVSLVTNLAAGISPTPLSHAEVIEAGQAAGPRISALSADIAKSVDQDESRRSLELVDSPDPRKHDVRVRALADSQDRFSGPLEFGTAGSRGRMEAGPHRMNRAVVIRAAAGSGAYSLDTLGPAGAGGAARPRVVVGFDARHRSRTFAVDSAAVLTAAGLDVLVSPSASPTPVLAFAVRHLGADAGVMVTASHNPPADNGYKVYLGGRVVTDSGQGAQIVPPYDAHIAAAIAAVGPARSVPRASSGWTVSDREVVVAYERSVLASSDGARRDLKVVTTASHGVGGETVAHVSRDAGFTTVVPVEEQLDPNPDFPSVAFPNPEEPGAMDLALAVAQDAAADVVLANDPDADRCAVAVLDPRVGTYQGAETARSNGWRMSHGDEVGALSGDDVARRVAASGAPGGVLACSIVSSRSSGKIAAAHGLGFATTLTGFKWISRVDGLVFGYEEALGYCVDPAHVRDKDGISAASLVAQLANRLKAEGRSIVDALDDSARAHGSHVSDQLSARFEDLDRIGETMAHSRAAPPRTLAGAGVSDVTDLSAGSDGLPPTDGVRILTADGTRVIVRPSGTEPKVKCYSEVVVPVAPDASHDDLTAARAFARDRIDRVKADMTRALGL
ncbi:hypothetical protein OY671_002611 [Metschnikowia pulcherrima]|nr:hypothetical protein OY671_002611 [Metschnikowia pulcherrima]